MQVVEGCEIGPAEGESLRILGTLVPLSQSLSVKPAVCCPCVCGCVSAVWMCACVCGSVGGLHPSLRLCGAEGAGRFLNVDHWPGLFRGREKMHA